MPLPLVCGPPKGRQWLGLGLGLELGSPNPRVSLTLILTLALILTRSAVVAIPSDSRGPSQDSSLRHRIAVATRGF